MNKPSLAAVSAFVLVSAFPLAAQQPYGRATAGSGGFAPQLSAAQPRLGGALTLDLQCALGSSAAAFFLAGGSSSVSIFGVDFALDPATLLTTLVASTSSGGAGTGRAQVSLPVPGSANLLGLTLYGQAAVVDAGGPAGLSASRGLRCSLTGAPAIFVACSIAGGDPFLLVEPFSGAILDSGTPPEVDNVTGAAFDQTGRRVFTASSIRGTIGVGNASSLPIAWSALYSAPATSTYGLEIDHRRQLVWTLTALTGGSRELVAIDIDPSSTTYGQAVHNTVGMLSGNAERFDVARSGNVAAVLTYLPTSLTIVDTDPSSATFLRNRFSQLSVPVDQPGVLTLANQVAITPDERYALVILQGVGTTPAEIARLDLRTGTWVDHDPNGPGTNIGPLSAPPILMGSAPTTLTVASHGRFAIVGGFGGCGWLGRLDLDPKDPLAFSYQQLAANGSLANGWTAALSNDETEVCVPTWGSGTCSLPSPQLERIDVTTGTPLGTIPIPANSNGGNQNWYTAVYR